MKLNDHVIKYQTCKLQQVHMTRKQWDKYSSIQQQHALTKFDIILEYKTFREKAVAFAFAVNMKNFDKGMKMFNKVMDQFSSGMDKAGLKGDMKSEDIFGKKKPTMNIFDNKKVFKI